MLSAWIKHCTPECRNIVRSVLTAHVKEDSGLPTHEIYDLALKDFPDAKCGPQPTPRDSPRIRDFKGTPTREPPRADHPIRSMKYLKRIVLEEMESNGEVEKFLIRGGSVEGKAFYDSDAWLWRLSPPGSQSSASCKRKAKAKSAYGSIVKGHNREYTKYTGIRPRTSDERTGLKSQAGELDAEFLPWQEEKDSIVQGACPWSGRGSRISHNESASSRGIQRRDFHLATTSKPLIHQPLLLSPLSHFALRSQQFRLHKAGLHIPAIAGGSQQRRNPPAKTAMQGVQKQSPTAPAYYGRESRVQDAPPPSPKPPSQIKGEGGFGLKSSSGQTGSQPLTRPIRAPPPSDEPECFGLRRPGVRARDNQAKVAIPPPQATQDPRPSSSASSETEEVGFGLKGYKRPPAFETYHPSMSFSEGHDSKLDDYGYGQPEEPSPPPTTTTARHGWNSDPTRRVRHRDNLPPHMDPALKDSAPLNEDAGGQDEPPPLPNVQRTYPAQENGQWSDSAKPLRARSQADSLNPSERYEGQPARASDPKPFGLKVNSQKTTEWHERHRRELADAQPFGLKPASPRAVAPHLSREQDQSRDERAVRPRSSGGAFGLNTATARDFPLDKDRSPKAFADAQPFGLKPASPRAGAPHLSHEQDQSHGEQRTARPTRSASGALGPKTTTTAPDFPVDRTAAERVLDSNIATGSWASVLNESLDDAGREIHGAVPSTLPEADYTSRERSTRVGGSKVEPPRSRWDEELAKPAPTAPTPAPVEDARWYREPGGAWKHGHVAELNPDIPAAGAWLSDRIANVPFSERLRQSRDAITSQISLQQGLPSKPPRSAIGKLDAYKKDPAPSGIELEGGSAGPQYGPLVHTPENPVNTSPGSQNGNSNLRRVGSRLRTSSTEN
ncbi:hypothetical protein FIBSPDRAFT_1036530 [Athelia psychrophila]|uniref:Uncharacterized protein n=1 Tax=Athelia psychrophila TaxID=1759441 RepID=A0A166VNK1_9AGAM|nr:hypothetical protein FIBSPDRAFT_1036530 [Fibularhizoctonia sp. CBS 109695]